MKNNWSLTVGLAWIALVTGLSAGAVGEMPKFTGPYPPELPLMMFLLMASNFILGYFAGRDGK